MKILTIRDFHSRPKQLRQVLEGEREAILTFYGRPVAVLIPTDLAGIDETLQTLRRVRGLEALRAIRRHSQGSGRGRLSTRDVDAIIARTRTRGRRARA